MLQRGRGKGYLMALQAAPETIWPLLFECITNDPRLDTQCEDRAEYYAGLIGATGMDVEPLGRHLWRIDPEYDYCECCSGLLLGTLGCVASKDPAALRILVDYVSYGRKWYSVILQILAELDSREALERTVATLCSRVRSDEKVRAEFEEVVRAHWRWYCRDDAQARVRSGYFLPICEPYKTLCERNSALAECFADVGIAYDQPPAPRERPSEEFLASLSLEDLFAQVNESNCARFRRVAPDKVSADHEDYLLEQLSQSDKYRIALALRGLGKLGTPRAFEAVKSCIESGENVDERIWRSALDAIEQMPGSLTLETARQWFRRKECGLQVAAGAIFENHATPEDIPLLIEVLRMPEALRHDDFRLSSALNALARFEGIGPVPELEQVFCEAQSCYDRYRAANAMAATSPVHFTAEYAFECLWDCHWVTRGLGCEMVDLSAAGTLDRLKELAGDPNESEDVREQAQARLEGF